MLVRIRLHFLTIYLIIFVYRGVDTCEETEAAASVEIDFASVEILKVAYCFYVLNFFKWSFASVESFEVVVLKGSNIMVCL